MLLRIFLDAVVSQMCESVVNVVKGVFIIGETEVALVVEPNCWRGKVLDGHPLADVEFPALDEERVFYVFLDNELCWLPEAVISYVVNIIEASYSSSSRHD